MGNICADLLKGAKMWEHHGDRREILSVRFQKALRPGKSRRDQGERLSAQARSPTGPGVEEAVLTTHSSQNPAAVAHPNGPAEHLPWAAPEWGRCQDSHFRNVTFFFFSASLLCCVTFMKNYTLHIFLICFLCKEKGKRTKRETTWLSQKPETCLNTGPPLTH